MKIWEIETVEFIFFPLTWLSPPLVAPPPNLWAAPNSSRLYFLGEKCWTVFLLHFSGGKLEGVRDIEFRRAQGVRGGK